MAFKVGIAGASGYTGVELLRLCAGHPAIEVVLATGDTAAGSRAAEVHPSLAAAYPDLRFSALAGAADFDGLELVFLCLPHGRSQELVPELRSRVGHIVDLGADFRLKDPGLYPTWYGHEHSCPELLGEFAFGIPELFREPLRGAPLIAAAGCYVTSAALALAPLVRAGAIATDGIVVDAASGVSGAGRAATATTHFGSVDGNFRAYGLLDHRHTPEIEQAIGAQVLFTPHLAPMTRGLLSTCYARPTDPGMTTDDVMALLGACYADEPFVVVAPEPPSTKATLGANTAMLTARVDPRTGWVVVLSALDNLVKGASGQMVQCANLALGLEETTGLPLVGVTP